MTRFAILLDSGATLPGTKTKRGTLARMWRWNEHRRYRLSELDRAAHLPPDERPIAAIPRCAIGLVTYRKEKR